MTSTVLDVTVMLLCVSAATVVVAGAADTTADADLPEAPTAADRLATETATVTFGPDGDRRLHVTLAEAVAAAAWSDGASGPDSGSGFRTAVAAAVEDALGPRVRIDVRATTATTATSGTPATSETPATTEGAGPTERRDSGFAVGEEPPRAATVAAAVVTLPPPATAPARIESARLVVRAW